MRIFAIVFAVALFASFCVVPAAAQTKRELRLYDKIMRRGATDRSMTKNLAKLQNEELLTRIVIGHTDFEIRNLALGKITSQKHLIEIAGRPVLIDWGIATAVLKKVENEEDLFQIFLNNPKIVTYYKDSFRAQNDYPVLMPPGVAGRLVRQTGYDDKLKEFLIRQYVDNQDLLYEILSDTAQLVGLRRLAVWKLTDQKLLVEVVKNHANDLIIYLDAIDQITDQNVLANIAKTDESPLARSRALNGLIDQSLLISLVAESGDTEIRNVAFGKLDSVSIASIAASRPPGDPMAVAARVTAKTSDWSAEINNTRQQIDEVISAMALVPSVAKPTVANIVDACHKYIRKGDEAKIPDLEFLLNNYGDMRLAEDYLNCGNQRLYDIGAAWARRHGYNIGTGAGSHRATWGSQR